MLAPVTGKVAASGKGKKKKKNSQVSATSGVEETAQLVVAGSLFRIVEMSSDDDMVDA